MPDLREQLAHRLEQVWLASIQSGLPGTSPFSWADWGKVSDECIRQMEWARRNNEGLRWPTMTLAPEDWNP